MVMAQVDLTDQILRLFTVVDTITTLEQVTEVQVVTILVQQYQLVEVLVEVLAEELETNRLEVFTIDGLQSMKVS